MCEKRRDAGVRRGFPSPRPAGRDASMRKWTEIGPMTAMFGRAPLDDASPCARRPDKKSGMPAETLSSEIYIPSRTHLAELLKAEEEEAVLVLGPGNACGKRRDENIRISTHSAPRVTARSSLAESRADQMRSGGFGKKRTNRGKIAGKKSSPFLRSLVGATAESDRWPSSLVGGGACLEFSSIGSADCVFRMPSVAASTSSDRPAMVAGCPLEKEGALPQLVETASACVARWGSAGGAGNDVKYPSGCSQLASFFEYTFAGACTCGRLRRVIHPRSSPALYLRLDPVECKVTCPAGAKYRARRIASNFRVNTLGQTSHGGSMQKNQCHVRDTATPGDSPRSIQILCDLSQAMWINSSASIGTGCQL